ncbi:uncharacterized protein LOC144152546 [Haemaphysalis longicornis]
MVNCVVFGCNSHTKKKPGDENVAEIKFFCIPKAISSQCKKTEEITSRRRAEWLRRINRKDLNPSANHYRVCSRHFISGRPAYAMTEEDPDWAPSLHMGHGPAANADRSLSRYNRQLQR